MKLELTEHDIFLLKLAGSALIAFLAIRFLVMPGLSRLQESTLRKEELEQTVSGMQAAIDSIPDLEQQTGERLAVLKEASAPYYQRMENRQVDELLTGLALKYGLFPVSLDIEGGAAIHPGALSLQRHWERRPGSRSGKSGCGGQRAGRERGLRP